jgi:hypothetical protein
MRTNLKLMMTDSLKNTFTYLEPNFPFIKSKMKKKEDNMFLNKLTGNFLAFCSLIKPITLPKDQSSFLRFFQVTKLTK